MLDLTQYQRPALHFSGGKDSLACLYLLRDQLDSLTVYWVNTQDQCPETLAVVEAVRPWVPNFVEIKTDARAWRRDNGDPTDLVPAKAHFLGVAYGMNDTRLSNRFDCCFANLMRPMHERMLADGVDAVIRGTKLVDTGKVPAEGRAGNYDVILPIKHWTHTQVFEYLESVEAPSNAIYEHFKAVSAPECLTCTAWWDDGKGEYLKTRHPQQYVEYRVSLAQIRATLASHLADLDSEIGGTP